MGLIATSVDKKLVEVPHEGVVSARLRRIFRVKIDPLILQGLELSQIIEVDAAFAGVASEEENAVFEGDAVGS